LQNTDDVIEAPSPDDAAERRAALRALRMELARALVKNAARGETAVSPDVLLEHVAFYRDQERFVPELRAFFRGMPVVACLSCELPEPGSYRTFDDAGAPILLTRGKEGRVRAFLNICPHRASRLVRDASGRANRFTCRFHGWTFDAGGRAIGIPDETQFCSEIEASKQLIECPAEERHGLVFLLTDPDGRMDLDAHLAGLDRDLAAIGLDTAEIVHSDKLHVDANWKYGLDTFFETYHLNALHRETFKGLFSPVCVFDTFGPHHRYTFAPLNIDAWVDMPESEWQVDTIPLQYFLFPNTILSVGSTSLSGLTVNVHRIFPSSADHFTSSLSYCAVGGVGSPEHRAEIDRAYQTARAALVNEDYSVASESHAGLAALPEGTRLPVGRREIGVWNFHRNVARLLAAAPDRAS
jgi:nitrite reductase/ring-hydroxylating ferredoxin subunit